MTDLTESIAELCIAVGCGDIADVERIAASREKETARIAPSRRPA